MHVKIYTKKYILIYCLCSQTFSKFLSAYVCIVSHYCVTKGQKKCSSSLIPPCLATLTASTFLSCLAWSQSTKAVWLLMPNSHPSQLLKITSRAFKPLPTGDNEPSNQGMVPSWSNVWVSDCRTSCRTRRPGAVFTKNLRGKSSS